MVETIMKMIFVFGVPLAVAAAIYGTRWKEGLWGNALSAMAILFAWIIAIGWYESVAIMLCERVPAVFFLADFLSFWSLFLVSLLVIGEVTRTLSRVKVFFGDPIEKVGNGFVLTIILALVLGIYYFALDMSPIGEYADATAPSEDTVQLKVIRMLTGGNLSSFTEAKEFDEDGGFRRNHFLRKQALTENREKKEGSLFYEGPIPGRPN